MYKNYLFSVALLIFCQTSFAEKCPSVKDIKNHHASAWKAYDSDDGTPLPAKREAEFRKSAQEFALAEWTSADKKTGSIHCYYRDNNGSDLEAYLAKSHFSLNNHKNYWYTVSGHMHCAAGMDKCEFNLLKNPHIARLANK